MVCGNLYDEIYSFRNLELAYKRARKNKRYKRSVRKFEFRLENNLLQLKNELESMEYEPRPLKTFVIMDPKTRVISASHFRDRIVHHALCNVIQPMFEKAFIHDSCANRVGRGTSKALERFEAFKRKGTQNGRPVNNAKDTSMVIGYVLKADIRHFFDTIDHEVLMWMITRRIKDRKTLSLIRKILDNHVTKTPKKGMPIGNLTSQFFANLYLNELDYFVKHELKVKYYIRYVDDFILIDRSKELLETCKSRVDEFLNARLKLRLHPEKSRVYPLHKGIKFLGFRIFYHYSLLRKSNIRKMERKLAVFGKEYKKNLMCHEDVSRSVESWMGYAKHGNTFKLRRRILKDFHTGNRHTPEHMPKHTHPDADIFEFSGVPDSISIPTYKNRNRNKKYSHDID